MSKQSKSKKTHFKLNQQLTNRLKIDGKKEVLTFSRQLTALPEV